MVMAWTSSVQNILTRRNFHSSHDSQNESSCYCRHTIQSNQAWSICSAISQVSWDCVGVAICFIFSFLLRAALLPLDKKPSNFHRKIKMKLNIFSFLSFENFIKNLRKNAGRVFTTHLVKENCFGLFTIFRCFYSQSLMTKVSIGTHLQVLSIRSRSIRSVWASRACAYVAIINTIIGMRTTRLGCRCKLSVFRISQRYTADSLFTFKVNEQNRNNIQSLWDGRGKRIKKFFIPREFF